MATCKSCSAPVRWVKLLPSGRNAPLDLEPSTSAGNVRLLDERGQTARVLTRAELAEARRNVEPLYSSHFATCVNAASHRKGEELMPVAAKPVMERIAPKVQKIPGGCWLWIGAKDYGGYPIVWLNAGRRGARVHRLMYERYRGPIPEGLTLDHLCRVRSCVNPDHLEPCTAGENARRSPDAPYWKRAAQTHCKRGHAFSESNTLLHHGRRECRACNAQRARERRATCPKAKEHWKR